MKEATIILIIVLLSALASSLGITFFSMVVYDKILHYGVGLVFSMIYFKIQPRDNIIIVATIFSILYEIFIYIVYQAPVDYLINDTINIAQFFKNFISKYKLIDEWLDVIASWLGVISIYPIDSDKIKNEKHS
ncbi:MAG: hypothetical protein OEZ01_12930 [Candidatus Heimdallarchaeota archaeon]|nr:hypothetical protein [Candidatus Heimdallarchaeota archaeon]MDH5646911.1 hypothetical protein [Candidatus Heimdallarchaeota archaeon]